MLNDSKLIEELGDLGITSENYRVLSLLPLVLVAWSDGKVQHAEHAKILELARSGGFLGGGESILTNWLREEPTDEYYRKGFSILTELARRERGLGSDINAETLQDLVDLSSDVASAAGGLFGKVWTVNDAEKTAIDNVATLLEIDDGQSWKELLEDLEQ